jgi:hypothetical protein
MNGTETEAVRFQHASAHMNKELQLALARIRRVEHDQQMMINRPLPPRICRRSKRRKPGTR